MTNEYYIYDQQREFDEETASGDDLIICYWDEDAEETADALFISSDCPNYKETAVKLCDLLNAGLISI